MIRRILIGYENGGHGEGALELGCRLASALEAETLVAHIYAYDRDSPPTTEVPLLEQWHELLQREADQLVTEAVSRCPVEASARGVAWASSSPARGLYELAESERADLVVVGSTRRGPMGRVLIGSTAEQLLQGAPCPVLVAPHTSNEALPVSAERDRGFATIGVGFNGRPESEAALELAQELAGELGSRLRLLFVVGLPSFAAEGASVFVPFPGDYGELAAALEVDARHKLEEALSEVRADTEAEGEMLTGDPAHLLATESERGLDLLVVGSRNYGPLRRVLLGAVSAKLARTAGCPVLLVPRAEGDPGHTSSLATSHAA